MPDVWDFLDEAAGYNHYCSFDMAKMFTQFRIKEAHKHLAAFITPRGVFEPNVVMFGLAGAPQHAVREVGGGMAKDPRTNGIKFTEWAYEQNTQGVTPPYDICPITKIVKGSRLRPFIDDVFIRSNHAKGMIKLGELFFEFCESHHLILSRKKASIMRRCLRTLGFVVSREGKHLDPARVDALTSICPPDNLPALKSLLGSFGFIRGWLASCADVAAPLTDLMAKSARELRFDWKPEHEAALDALKLAVRLAPATHAADYTLPFHIFVDASDIGMAAVLVQWRKNAAGDTIPAAILHKSRRFSARELRWQISERELAAIKYGMEHFREYVQGHPDVTVHTDHLNLVTGLW